MIAALVHASAVTSVISNDELLRTTWVDGGVVTRHQFNVNESMRDWVEKRFHFRPKEQVVTVWLSRDSLSSQILAGMIKQDVRYQQQPISLVIGLSHGLRVSRAAIVALLETLRQEFESSIGVGYLKRYTMMSVRQLRYLANVLQKEGQPSALVGEQLFKSGAILAAVIKTTGLKARGLASE